MSGHAGVNHTQKRHGDVGEHHWRGNAPNVPISGRRLNSIGPGKAVATSEGVDAGELFANDQLVYGFGAFVGNNAFEV